MRVSNSSGKSTLLSNAEKQVWRAFQLRQWREMQELFPRLKNFSAPPLPIRCDVKRAGNQ